MDEKISLIISACTLIGIVIVVYKSITEPNKKQDEELAVNSATCNIKHDEIEKKFTNINENLSLIKENHLKHIEERISSLSENQVKIFTILEERLPKK